MEGMCRKPDCPETRDEKVNDRQEIESIRQEDIKLSYFIKPTDITLFYTIYGNFLISTF